MNRGSSSPVESVKFGLELHERFVILGEITCNVLVVRFVRSTSNLKQFGIAPKALNVVLTDVPIATQCLDGAVCYPFAHVAAEKLNAIRVCAVSGLVELQFRGHIIDIAPARHVLPIGLSDVPLDLAERRERLPK